MSSVGLMVERPPVVRFMNEEQEDRNASIEAGYYIPRNVAMAEIIPPGGRDTVKREADELIKTWYKDAMEGRKPMDWYNHLKAVYDGWKSGNEIPEFGTPVMTFLPFTPGQRQQLINANVRTVEDCAAMNEETMQKVGMGAREMKDRAAQAMSTADKTAAENAAMKIEIEQLKEQMKLLLEQKSHNDDEEKRKPGRPKMS